MTRGTGRATASHQERSAPTESVTMASSHWRPSSPSTLSVLVVTGLQSALETIFVILGIVVDIVYAIWEASLSIVSLIGEETTTRMTSNNNNNNNNRNVSLHRPASPQQTVVIVGGGFAGLAALQELREQQPRGVRFRIVLMDAKTYFEYTPGVLRLFCDPKHLLKVAGRLPTSRHHDVLQGKVLAVNQKDDKGNTFLLYQHCNKNGSTTSLSSSSLLTTKTKPPSTTTTTTTRRLYYHHLILATGTRQQTWPITPSFDTDASLSSRAQTWYTAHRRLLRAKSILILGGGAVGVELAAEIVCHFRGSTNNNKTVTLIQSSDRLVPLLDSDSTSRYALAFLERRGVRVLLNTKPLEWNEHECTLPNGTKLTADIVHVCFGSEAHSDMLSRNNNNNNNRTRIPVNVHLQYNSDTSTMTTTTTARNSSSTTAPPIFCCGDVALPPTEGLQQAFQAEIQGIVAARNVVRLATGRPLGQYPQDMAESSRMPLIYVLSLGRYDGVVGLNGFVLCCGPIAAVLKWILEYTKVLQLQGNLLGKVIWKIGDAAVLWLSRILFFPAMTCTNDNAHTDCREKSIHGEIATAAAGSVGGGAGRKKTKTK